MKSHDGGGGRGAVEGHKNVFIVIVTKFILFHRILLGYITYTVGSVTLNNFFKLNIN
jgi:hypothetical protein